MKEPKKKIIKIAGIIIGVTISFLIIASTWLYSGNLTAGKIKIFQSLPYPLAFVNGKAVLMRDFIFRLNVARHVNSAAGEQDISQAIYSQMIIEEKIRQIAYARKVFVSDREVEQEYSRQAGEQNFSQKLVGYGLDLNEFKIYILRRQLLATNLQTWFNAQTDLNNQTYGKAAQILEKISQGQKMADLAVADTEDNIGRETGGDLGFVDLASTLPELRQALAGMKTGEVKILPSRLGLHIIQLEGQNQGRLHLWQIFLKNDNFEDWVYNQTKDFKVRQIYKPK